MNSDKVRRHYDHLNTDYLKCWSSPAKQDINRFELNLIGNKVKQLSSKKRIKVLEIGVGPGRIAQAILKYQVDYYALDISSQMIRVVKDRFVNNQKIKKIIKADISKKVPFPKEKFDLIIAMRVIYYNRNWKEVIEKLTDKINPGGSFIFCMLNKNSTAILGKLINKDRLEGHYTTLGELKDILIKNNFKKVSLWGYARIPDVVYDKCGSKLSATVLRMSENILSALFGKTLFVRMFYVTAQKPKDQF